MRYGELPALEKQLEDAKAQNAKRKGDILQDEVTEEQINQIISRWTGIPVARLKEGEREKILHLAWENSMPWFINCSLLV